MKFIIGLLIGAGLAYGWFSTYGRLQRTDIVIETRTNVVTRVQYETVVVTQDVFRSVWQTNVVTITNIISTRPQIAPVNVMDVPDRPRARTPTTPPQPRQPAPTYTVPAVTKPTPSGFRGPRNLPGRDRHGNVTNRNVHIRM